MKDLLLKEFENDPIYRMAILNGLKDDLFTDGILSMHENLTYSTVETGKIIDRSDSTIRNHFRSDLIDYIQPEKFGKYYRLNYKSVFRLHMIFVLMEKASKTSVDILAELGIHPAISLGGNLKRVKSNESRELQDTENRDIAERILNLEKSFSIQGIMLNIVKYEKDLSDIERQIDSKKSLIEKIETDAYMKYLEEKNTQMLTLSLKKSIQKPSFFGMFKKTEEVDVSQITQQVEENLKQKMLQSVQEKIKSFNDNINVLEKEREKVKLQLQGEREAFSNLQIESKSSTTKLLNNVE